VRRALLVLCVFTLDVSLLERAWAAQACAWIVESVEDDGTHVFRLSLSADAPLSASVRFQGPGFTSASRGGDLIPLAPGEPEAVDGEGFLVGAGDDLRFDVRLFDHPLGSLDEMKTPTGRPLASFAFHATAGADGRTQPADLARQCKPLG
jgi:hypothetical protein